VDSGYWTHAPQTLALVREAGHGRVPDLLLNTHLHSDHCGGNAALQQAYPGMQTLIPPGLAPAVEHWDPLALTYQPTGQHCPPFNHQGLLKPGATLELGSGTWEVHGAKGHDPHAIVLFEPRERILISADALWENGFGVVFPELEGVAAFDEVAQTLDVIEHLAPATVLPGHGRPFTNLTGALKRARERLELFTRHPDKHERHAWKVLIKYKLLEWQSISVDDLTQWVGETPYLARAIPTHGAEPKAVKQWLQPLLYQLQAAGALRVENAWVYNT
jgi:glyoxylase-like metal-dependent hydrolase (beta-lactamase superfamily II)